MTATEAVGRAAGVVTMRSRSSLPLVASALTAIAGVVANQDGESSIVPFFFGLTFVAGFQAWATHPPFTGPRGVAARAVAVAWLVAAVWIAALLAMYVMVWSGSSSPQRAPAALYLGLPGTAYHLAAVYGGLILVILAAAAPDRFFAPTSGPSPDASS